METIKKDGYYVLARYRDGKFLGLHHKKGLLTVYGHISSAKSASTRLENLSGGNDEEYKIVKLSILIDESTIVEKGE